MQQLEVYLDRPLMTEDEKKAKARDQRRARLAEMDDAQLLALREYKRNWARNRRANDPAYVEKEQAYRRRKLADAEYVARRRAAAKLHKQNPEYIKKQWVYTRDQRASRLTWPRHIVRVVRSRAKKAGIPFSLVHEDIASPETCPICLQTFNYGGPKNDPHLPSLDRHVPALGYCAGNVNVICYDCNKMKAYHTDPDRLRRLADYVEKGR